MLFKQKSHSYPLVKKLDTKFNLLLNVICNEIPYFQPIPRYVKEGAEAVLMSLQNRCYPTQGRRIEAFVITSLGIARGDKNINDLQDLQNRAEYIFGERIPSGQIRNTFNELNTFLKYHRQYKWRSRKPTNIFTPEDRKVLSFLNSKETFPRK